jgi:hypothetical protein
MKSDTEPTARLCGCTWTANLLKTFLLRLGCLFAGLITLAIDHWFTDPARKALAFQRFIAALIALFILVSVVRSRMPEGKDVWLDFFRKHLKAQ